MSNSRVAADSTSSVTPTGPGHAQFEFVEAFARHRHALLAQAVDVARPRAVSAVAAALR